MKAVKFVRFSIVHQLIVTTFGAIIYWELSAVLDTRIFIYTKLLFYIIFCIISIFEFEICIIS